MFSYQERNGRYFFFNTQSLRDQSLNILFKGKGDHAT